LERKRGNKFRGRPRLRGADGLAKNKYGRDKPGHLNNLESKSRAVQAALLIH
jgi:hypothetical protein